MPIFQWNIFIRQSKSHGSVNVSYPIAIHRHIPELRKKAMPAAPALKAADSRLRGRMFSGNKNYKLKVYMQ